MTRGLLLAGAAVAVLAAAVFDVRHGRIPDWLTWPALAAALASRALLHGVAGEAGLLTGAAGALLAALVGVPMALWARMGWGDVKLLAAVGAFFAWPAVAAALLAISLCGAAQAAGAAALARLRSAARPAGIPYGVAIATGSLLAAIPLVR